MTLHAYNVRPRVFGATTGVQGAVTIRRDDLRTKGAIRRVAPVTIQRTNHGDCADGQRAAARKRSARASAANSAVIRRALCRAP